MNVGYNVIFICDIHLLSKNYVRRNHTTVSIGFYGGLDTALYKHFIFSLL